MAIKNNSIHKIKTYPSILVYKKIIFENEDKYEPCGYIPLRKSDMFQCQINIMNEMKKEQIEILNTI